MKLLQLREPIGSLSCANLIGLFMEIRESMEPLILFFSENSLPFFLFFLFLLIE